MPAPEPIAEDLAAELPREDVVRILDLFRADISRLADLIGPAAAEGDETAFRQAAHGLAGAAGTLGATRLEAASRRAMSHRNPVPDLPAAAAEIAALTAATLVAVDRRLAAWRATGTF